jgi:NAD(P)-dependent dehydrogenase (short-subunit alcohol dehydrogenase family)
MSKQRRTISGRTAVITGAACGIGRALAQRLSAHGWPVAIADVDEHGLKETRNLPAGAGPAARARRARRRGRSATSPTR